MPRGDRRALRPVVEGFHAGHGQGGLRRTEQAGAAESFHRRHQRRRLAHQPDADPTFPIEPHGRGRAVFYGLGADGTVGANKNTVKIIAEDAGLYAQGYFVYDSQKSGAQTISHLRFGPQPIRAPYLIQQASFVGVPPVPVPRAPRRAAAGRARRHLPAERPYRPGRDLGPTAARDADADHRAEAAVLRHRRLQGGRGRRHARAHQHHPADLLLRHLRRAAARRGDRADQEVDQEDLRQARRGRGADATSSAVDDTLASCSR